MKRKKKSLLSGWKWLLLAVTTSLLIILTQVIPVVTAQETPESVVVESTSTTNKTSVDETEAQQPQSPAVSPEEISRQQTLIKADQLFVAGEISAAEKLYREVKTPFTTAVTTQERKPAILDPEQLSPAGKVYWRESTAGIAKNLQTRTLVPLQLLVEQYPEFIPGHIRFAKALKQYNRSQEALDILERAVSLYPHESTLVDAQVSAMAEAKKWMEASLTARQFAILNPDHPQASKFQNLADENLKNFKSYMGGQIRGNAIANIITGALGYAVTGSLLGPVSAIDSTVMLLQGEAAIGESVAQQAKKQLDLIEDETVTAYINEIGAKLVKVAGRNDFKYEFNVIAQEDLNAFALPGGKIFINAGAIAKTNSEAELAGLLAHELSHTVLSHGFQIVTQGNLIANVTQYLPFGGTIGQLFALNYSRDMERQADELGTRLIVAGGYAADGLRNLMVTLAKEQRNFLPPWLSSHPGGSDRVSYLENLISRGNYNRYAYEGVEPHITVQAQIKQIIEEKKKEEQEKSPSP